MENLLGDVQKNAAGTDCKALLAVKELKMDALILVKYFGCHYSCKTMKFSKLIDMHSDLIDASFLNYWDSNIRVYILPVAKLIEESELFTKCIELKR